MRYSFTIEVDGNTYKCERVVTGKRVLRQNVHVIGVGSKNDPASYGPRAHPRITMESVARLIAREIISGR